jgi:hypothetical protein
MDPLLCITVTFLGNSVTLQMLELAGETRPPGGGVRRGPVGQEGEHEVELLLNSGRAETRHGGFRSRATSIVRWRGGHMIRLPTTVSEWLRAEELKLGHCPEKVAEYDAAAAPRRRPAVGRPAVVTRAPQRSPCPPLRAYFFKDYIFCIFCIFYCIFCIFLATHVIFI